MDVNEEKEYLQIFQSLINLLIRIRLIKKKRKRLRRWWTKPHLYSHIRNTLGAYSTIFTYFQFNDHEEFKSFVRMDIKDFEALHDLVKHRLQKQVGRRPPIHTGIRLAATLHYLGHGGSIRGINLFFRIGLSTTYNIISETCMVIASVLVPLYVQLLANERQWLQIAEEFETLWNFPNCIGALDGKHIRIQRPPHSGSKFYNYKKFDSVVLMALCDAYSRFIWFSIGDFGSCNDPSVFSASSFSNKLQNNELSIPESRALPRTNMILPHVIISDEIFQLNTYLMKPFKRSLNLNFEERIFNYRLSLARFTIERAFGILASKWRILRKALAFDLSVNNHIVVACITLHNFLITRNTEELNIENRNHIYERHLLHEDAAVQRLSPTIIRRTFAHYFCSPEGSIPYQHLHI